METQLEPDATPSKQHQADVASERLKIVSQELKATRKVLARDWKNLEPRERLAYARAIKDLEL